MTAPLVPIERAQWPRRKGLQKLIAALGPDNMRWVGGAVRDSLLGLEVKDVDCATVLRPEAVIEACTAAFIRTVPTGIDHGTVTAVLDDGAVEITTLRRDVSTDGRRATVAFSNDWKEDASRRDFTINALYLHPVTLEISDYFGGIADLEARRVRFIGDPRQRIAEDHLRILRYFRFKARFAPRDSGDEAAEAACADLAATLKGLSRERIAKELLGLLALDDPAPTLRRMHELGVLGVILPEATDRELARLEQLVAAEDEQGFAPHSIRRLAALIPPIKTIAEALAARLRLSRAQRARLVCASEREKYARQSAEELAYRLGPDHAIDCLLLSGRDARALNQWRAPQFPLKGGEIVARGVKAGPQVARLLHEIEERWIAEGFPDAQRVQQMLDEALGKAPRPPS